MNDGQNLLGVKNMSDLLRKEIHGIIETKTPTKYQVKKYKRRVNELDNNSNTTFMYVHSDLMSIIIKNCMGEKKEQKKNIWF